MAGHGRLLPLADPTFDEAAYSHNCGERCDQPEEQNGARTGESPDAAVIQYAKEAQRVHGCNSENDSTGAEPYAVNPWMRFHCRCSSLQAGIKPRARVCFRQM